MTTIEEQVSPTVTRGAMRVRHIGPIGARQAALEMGVQYQVFCGMWRWPAAGAEMLVKYVSDLTADIYPMFASICVEGEVR